MENDAVDVDDVQNSGFPVVFSRQSSVKTRSSDRNFRIEAKRIVRRLIKKNGASNVIRVNITPLWDRYIRDFSNTLVHSKWRWTTLCLSSTFILSWALFAIVWMLIANANGDFDPENPTQTPCLSGIEGFGGYFMFSMETQQTIGYGTRYINHHCPEATFVMCLQVILGCAFCGAMVSIVNAKMVRPLQMHSTNLFSKFAVICLRDGVLCLVIRVRDENARYGMGTAINAYVVQKRPGEPFLKSLSLEPSGMLIWPLEIVHKITYQSPLWDLSAKDLITKRFEIIATMRGTSFSTGQSSETRTSYLSTEILWGARFKPCVHFNCEEEKYWVEHSEFNTTVEVLTPLCSSKRLQEVIGEIKATGDYRLRLSALCGKAGKEEEYGEEEDGNLSDSSDYDNIEGENANGNRNGSKESVIDLEALLSSLEEAVRIHTENEKITKQ